MIDRFMGDSFWVLSCQFWSGVLQCGARLPIHLKLLDRAVSGARFLTVGVFGCDITHHRSVVVLSLLYEIRCNPMHPLNVALSGLYVPVRIARLHIGILMRRPAAEPRSTSGLLFLS